MKLSYLLITYALCLSLLACEDPRPPPDLIKPQRDALDKAKGLEQTIQTQTEDTKKKINDAEGR